MKVVLRPAGHFPGNPSKHSRKRCACGRLATLHSQETVYVERETQSARPEDGESRA